MALIRHLRRKKLLNYGVRWLSAYSSPLVESLPVVSQHGQRFSGFVSPPPFPRVIKANKQLSLHCLVNTSFFTTHAAVEHTSGGMVDVPLAQTGEGIAECELLKWFVQEGDQVEEFQPLCEVQSDKATIEITSRYKGKISHIHHTPGDIVKVGETLLKMAVEGVSSAVTDGFSEPTFTEHSEQVEPSSEVSFSNENRPSGVLCTPAVRNLAKQHGVELNEMKGSGKDGRILKEDILGFVDGKDVDTKQFVNHSNRSLIESSLYEDKTLELRGFQRAMVKSMTMAARIPHFYYVEEIDCGALVELKASFQNENPDQSIKHTYLPFLVKSLSTALDKYPLLNSCFNEDVHEIILKGSHNIGIAMATTYGLVVPNIKKVQSLSILEDFDQMTPYVKNHIPLLLATFVLPEVYKITKEISRLQQLAKENKLSHDDISGGTITLSNIGAIGGKFGSPLINLPEVAIIAIGRIQKVPQITNDGTVYPTPVMNVNIGADHRVLDGATVAKFCNEWKSLVEKPELMLLHTR